MADNFCVFFSPRQLTLVSLWLLALALLCLRPLSDLDLFTQLRLGAIVLSKHSLIRHEPLVYPVLNQPIANPGWLSQIIFATLAALGGLKTVKLVHDACFAAALVLPLLSHRRDSVPGLSGFLTLLLALMVCASNSSVRAQGIALFAFAVLMIICEQRRSWQLFVATFSLFVFWQNVHPSLSLATLYVLARFIESFFRPAPRRYYIELFFLSIACQFLTPDGTLLLSLSSRNEHISRTLLGVSEWLPPWHGAVRSAMWGFWIALALTLTFIAAAPKRLAALPLAALPFLGLALYSSRFAVFWAVVMIPFWREAFSTLQATRRMQEALGAMGRRLGLALPALLLALAFFRPLPFSPEIPIGAVRRLARLLPEGRVYNYREWAGPLVYFGSQKWQVAIDGRLYLYSPEEWNRYNREAAGEVPISEIFRSQAPLAFFLRPSFQKGLLDMLKNDPGFEVCAEDELTVIVLPRGRC